MKHEAGILRQCQYSNLSVHLTFKQEKSVQANKEIRVYGRRHLGKWTSHLRLNFYFQIMNKASSISLDHPSSLRSNSITTSQALGNNNSSLNPITAFKDILSEYMGAVAEQNYYPITMLSSPL